MAIKTLQNNFTTPEQSKRLLELGVPPDSADCYLNGNSIIMLNGKTFQENYNEDLDLARLHLMEYPHYLPCWSVGRLIEMWEICVGVNFDRWSRNGVLLPLIEDCIGHIEFALNPYTEVEFDFSKLEE